MRRYEYDYYDLDEEYIDGEYGDSFLRYEEERLREKEEEERKEKLWKENIGYKDHNDYRPAYSKEEEYQYNKERDFVISAGARNLAECKLLLSQGVDVNANNSVGTALGYAAKNGHIEVCKFLIRQGADIELYTIDGETSLNGSCRNWKD